MTHALNLTLPIKQDPETLKALADLKRDFAGLVQPLIADALLKSKIVHFARVLVIDDKYIQVITEYEGDHQEYTEFFRKELTPIFAKIFSLAAEVPLANDTAKFWEYSKDHNIRSLGEADDDSLDFDGNRSGWLFSAYDHKTVKELKSALEG